MALTMIRDTCPHADHPRAEVEFFWSPPSCGSPGPLILLSHGHNPGLRYGARTDLWTGIYEFFADNGVGVVSVSQPGYAGSTGPADYCGPFSQRALSSVLDVLCEDERVDAARVGVYGLSRGGTVALLAAIHDTRIHAAVAVAPLCNVYEGFQAHNEGIRESLGRETDASDEALIERSIACQVERIRVPSLIIHGAQDDVAPFEFAQQTVHRARRIGAPLEFHSFDQYGHGIPFKTCAHKAWEFFQTHGVIDHDAQVEFRLSFSHTAAL